MALSSKFRKYRRGDPDQANEYDEIAQEQEEPDIRAVTESAITTTDWTVETLVGQIQKGNIELSPQFQRRFAWSDIRRSQFIESLALRYPVPQIVLARDRDESSKLIVIDGKQRLMTLAQFFGIKRIGKLKSRIPPLKLRRLTIKKNWNGETCASIRKNPLWVKDLAVLENATMRSVVVSTWASEEFLYSIFVRLNQGSLPLSPQELRQALRPGSFTRFADTYSANSEGLKTILGLSNPDFRMRDVELLIRFLAFRFRETEYRGNLKAFLDETCDHFNKNWSNVQSDVSSECKRLEACIETAVNIFGEEGAFRKYTKNGYETRLNRAVFDVVAYALAEPKVRQVLKQSPKAKRLKAGFESLCQKGRFRRSIESTTKSLSATRTRFSLFLDLVRRVTGHKVPFGLK